MLIIDFDFSRLPIIYQKYTSQIIKLPKIPDRNLSKVNGSEN